MAFYLIEVTWSGDSPKTDQPLNYRMVAELSTKEDCDRQAERQARAHRESGFDPQRDAWWGKSDGIMCYYHQTSVQLLKSWDALRQILGYPEFR